MCLVLTGTALEARPERTLAVRELRPETQSSPVHKEESPGRAWGPNVSSISKLKMTGKGSFEEENLKYTNMKMCSISLMIKYILES